MIPGIRTCKTCGETKAIELFVKQGQASSYRWVCTVCFNAAVRERYHDGGEESRKYSREKAKRWRVANPERARAQNMAWRAANPTAYKEYRRRAYQSAKASGKTKEAGAVRRARLKDPERIDLVALLAEHGRLCHICQLPIEEPHPVHWDHVIPLSRDGKHEAENLRPSHKNCNAWKAWRTMDELPPGPPPVPDPDLEARIEARRRELISKAMKGKKRKGGGPGRIRQGWGNGLEACVECGTNERPHKSKGLCNGCYLRSYRKTNPPARPSRASGITREEANQKRSEGLKQAYAEGRRVAGHSEETKRKISASKVGKGPTRLDVWAKYGGACQECGQSNRKHDGHGLCERCGQKTRMERRQSA